MAPSAKDEGRSIRTRAEPPSGITGLTLIEVVVAVCLLAGVLFTLGILIPRTVLHLRNHGFEAVAAQKAEDVINRTRGLDAADIPTGTFDGRPETGVPPVQRTPDETKWAGKRRYPPSPYPYRDVTMDVNGSPQTIRYAFRVTTGEATAVGTRPISVTVYWYEPQGNGVSVERAWTVSSLIGP